jgi:hypothetical protein
LDCTCTCTLAVDSQGWPFTGLAGAERKRFCLIKPPWAHAPLSCLANAWPVAVCYYQFQKGVKPLFAIGCGVLCVTLCETLAVAQAPPAFSGFGQANACTQSGRRCCKLPCKFLVFTFWYFVRGHGSLLGLHRQPQPVFAPIPVCSPSFVTLCECLECICVQTLAVAVGVACLLAGCVVMYTLLRANAEAKGSWAELCGEMGLIPSCLYGCALCILHHQRCF